MVASRLHHADADADRSASVSNADHCAHLDAGPDVDTAADADRATDLDAGSADAAADRDRDT